MTDITRGSRVVFPVTVGGLGQENHRTLYRAGKVVSTWRDRGADRTRIREDSERYTSGRRYLTRPVAVLVLADSPAGQRRLAEGTWNDRYTEWERAGRPAHLWRPLAPGATACWQCGHQDDSVYHQGGSGRRRRNGYRPCHREFPGRPTGPGNHLEAGRTALSAAGEAPGAAAGMSGPPGAQQESR